SPPRVPGGRKSSKERVRPGILSWRPLRGGHVGDDGGCGSQHTSEQTVVVGGAGQRRRRSRAAARAAPRAIDGAGSRAEARGGEASRSRALVALHRGEV